MRSSRKNEKYIWAFVALTGLYFGLYLGLPSDPEALQRYGITQTHARLLGLTIMVPLMAVFYFALYGFLRFREYADSIVKTKEGKGFSYLANSLMVLAFSLPVTSSITAVLNYIAISNPDVLPMATIVKNYIALLFPFITFLLLARGTEELVSSLKTSQSIKHFNGIGVIILSCFFTWLITTRPMGSGGEVTYYLPNWLIISTLAVPYLYMWTRGIMAIFNLRLYMQNIKGTVYKHALGYLAKGIVGIVFLSIFIQLVTTLSARLNRLSLTPILFILYILVAMYAVGYGYVARGAKKLKKIEDV